MVFPFARTWRADAMVSGSAVVARWADGEPAALERPVGAGCIRDVAVSVPTVGDLVLRPSFVRLLRLMGAPCGKSNFDRPGAPADPSLLAGSGGLAARGAIRPTEAIAAPLVPWFLAAAFGLGLLELLVRRGGPALEVEPGS